MPSSTGSLAWKHLQGQNFLKRTYTEGPGKTGWIQTQERLKGKPRRLNSPTQRRVGEAHGYASTQKLHHARNAPVRAAKLSSKRLRPYVAPRAKPRAFGASVS